MRPARGNTTATRALAHAPAPVASLALARRLGVDTCGRIAEFWGFTRTMGRVFGLLYLAPRPLPQVEVQRRLAISAGSASMTLAALGRWGVVHRAWLPGERREHYSAETDFWKMISGVLNERERREITAAVGVVERAKLAARAVNESTVPGTRNARERAADALFVAERLDRLHDICLLGQTLLDMLLGQLKLDVGSFRDILRVAPASASVPSSEPALPPAGTPRPRRRGRPRGR